ncbi:transmembrane protein, putative [Medicago truncatula]|uniref:Transmembrane protein, putative n=1 Tax=Medicago truncatula TaxID=3880 RepID=G7JZZ3_MEDTR|nr:transmembrane protein, putative [Medicago truncatula]
MDEDFELNTSIRVLRAIIVTSMSIFQSLLSFLALPASKSKSTKWLRVEKLMHICENNLENFNELRATLEVAWTPHL